MCYRWCFDADPELGLEHTIQLFQQSVSALKGVKPKEGISQKSLDSLKCVESTFCKVESETSEKAVSKKMKGVKETATYFGSSLDLSQCRTIDDMYWALSRNTT